MGASSLGDWLKRNASSVFAPPDQDAIRDDFKSLIEQRPARLLPPAIDRYTKALSVWMVWL